MREPAPPRAVTIVVPMYGDVASLTRCLDSLVQHVDLTRHRLLLVNDCGPEVDDVELAVAPVVAAHSAVSYVRNDANLGFVGTCNRAVLELDRSGNEVLLLNSDTEVTAGFLDELLGVLYADPRHAAVCPRSNNATIATLPYGLRDAAVPRTPERTIDVHGVVRALLPRFSVAPVAMGFCLLIRREVIEQFGLFDDAFAPGYGEENDFCLRIRAHGWMSVIAHRALVLHLGGRSFTGARRARLRAAHEALLQRRYPHYRELVRRYLLSERDPVDVFADTIAAADGVTRVLVDATDPALALDWIRALIRAGQGSGLRVTVATSVRRGQVLRREFESVRVGRIHSLFGQWDLAILASDTLSAENRWRLNQASPRWLAVGVEHALATAHQVDRDPAGVVVAATRVIAAPLDLDALRERWDAVAANTPTRSRRAIVGDHLRGWGVRAPLLAAVARRLRRRFAPRNP